MPSYASARPAPWFAMRGALVWGIAALASVPPLVAQGIDVTPHWLEPAGRLALLQALRDVGTDQTVMVVASHPDDRYVMPAAYLRLALGWRVAIVLMTRGEGGQNSRGPETGDELGWIRSLEAEAGAALLDASVWYANRQDAGFCRTAKEALDLWGREETVRALARLIRRIQPDVIITTHHPEEEHGHDLALLEVLPEAIAMAEDAAAHATELVGLPPVRVSKVFRGPATAETARVRDFLPVDTVDSRRGSSYRELAYAALRRHLSQAPLRPIDELFALTVPLMPLRDSDRARPESWLLQAGLPSLVSLLPAGRDAEALRDGLTRLAAEEGPRPQLLEEALDLRARLTRLAAESSPEMTVRLERRREALDRVLRAISGFRISAEVAPGVVPCAEQPFELVLGVHCESESLFRNVAVAAADGAVTIAADVATALRDPVPRGARRFTLVFTASPKLRERRTWLEQLFRAERFDPPVRLDCRVDVQSPRSPTFQMRFPVVVPTDIRPPVEVEVIPGAMLLTRDTDSQWLAVRVLRHDRAPLHGRLEVLGSPGFEVQGSPTEVAMPSTQYQDFPFELRVPQDLLPGVYNMHVHLDAHDAVLPLHRVDVHVPPNLTVALIPGVDDSIRNVLRSLLGDRLVVLEEELLALQDLQRFDSIVVDIRALRPRADGTAPRAGRAALPRLLEFVRLGGRLVVFYHKDTEFNAESTGCQAGPYPIHLGKGRVTHEDAPVEIVAPEHRLLSYPNVIRAEDWDGWVQERGLYFPDVYAGEYEEIVAMNDPGHPSLRGGILYARHGEGDYVYCALALHRQLKNLHSGACRLLVNMVAR